MVEYKVKHKKYDYGGNVNLFGLNRVTWCPWIYYKIDHDILNRISLFVFQASTLKGSYLNQKSINSIYNLGPFGYNWKLKNIVTK